MKETEKKLAEAEMKLAEAEQKLMDTEKKLTETQTHLSDTIKKKIQDSLFRLQNIKHDDALIKFYSGLPCERTFEAFFEEVLKCDASMMSANDYGDIKAGPPYILPLEEQLFKTLVS